MYVFLLKWLPCGGFLHQHQMTKQLKPRYLPQTLMNVFIFIAGMFVCLINSALMVFSAFYS